MITTVRLALEYCCTFFRLAKATTLFLLIPAAKYAAFLETLSGRHKRLPDRLSAALLAALLVLTTMPSKAPAQNVAGAPTLGLFLNSLADKVNQAVLDAGNVGNGVTMEAGRQAALAISDAQAAYQNSLSASMATIDPTIKNTTDKLQSLVNDIEMGTVTTVADATSRAQQIVNSLPFSNQEPQVRRVSPGFVPPSIPGGIDTVTVRFEGNFPLSARDGFGAKLDVNGTIFQASSNVTQEVTFSIPRDALFPVAATSPNKIQFTRAVARIPWETTSWLGLVHKRHIDSFSVIVGSLPTSPGTITLLHTTTSTVVTQPTVHTGGGHHQASTSEAGNNDDINHPYEETPDPGYSLVRGTSRLVPTSQQGDLSSTFVSDDANRVRYNVTTIHHGLGSSGSIDFHIDFQETTTQTISNTSSEPIVLLWGNSKVFNYPAGTWKLLFDSFDGHHSEYTGSDVSNPFITISNENGSVFVKTKDVASLAWP